MDWTKIYKRQVEPSQRDILERAHGLFSGMARFFVYPNIPPQKLSAATESYMTLQTDELLIGMWDDTAFGGAKDGFCLTTKRLYWHNLWSKAEVIAYEDIPGPIQLQMTTQVSIGNGMYIGVAHTEGVKLRPALIQFLTEAREHFVNPMGAEPLDASAGLDDRAWFIGRGGQQYGPYGMDTLRSMLSTRQLDGQALAWREGLASWLPIDQIPELKSLLVQSAPPGPPPLPGGPPPLAGAGPAASPGGVLVDINEAPEDQIARLPGVGPILAKRIVKVRSSQAMASIEELGRVVDLSPHIVDRLRPLVRFSVRPAESRPKTSGRLVDY